MQARGRLLLLLGALAASLALPMSAGAATGKASELKLGSFELEGSNGYEIVVSSVREGDSTPVALLEADRGSLEASYQVQAEPGAGIHAAFGSLGRLDVSFERRNRDVKTLEPGCRWIFEAGIFRGSFRFVGEGGYFSVEAVDPPGEVVRLPNGFCGFEDDRRARPYVPGLFQTVLAARRRTDSGTASFEASRFEDDTEAFFTASLRERVDQMTIERTARANGGKRTFSRSKTARASVHPPQPFLGSAKFRDPANGAVTWTGSLSVSLPGAPDVPLTGGEFTAKLCPRLFLLSRCLRGGAAQPQRLVGP